MVRVFYVPNGVVLWQHITTPGPGFQDLLSAIALSDDVVYATGTSGQDFVSAEFVVRAYNLRNGKILLEDKSHRSTSGSSGFDIAVGSRQVYAVGGISDRGSADFLIRAYDRGAIEPKRKLFTKNQKRLNLDTEDEAGYWEGY
jgi:hypothetical protein